MTDRVPETRILEVPYWRNGLIKAFSSFFFANFDDISKLIALAEGAVELVHQLAFNPFLGMISGFRIRHYSLVPLKVRFSFQKW